jgi:hypothetical protein
MGDLFAMLGANSVETWTLTGDPDLPWTRVSQRTFGRGIFNSGAKAEVADANTVYFISSDGMVCKMAGDAPQRVSDSALEEDIKLASRSAFSAISSRASPLSLCGLRMSPPMCSILWPATCRAASARRAGIIGRRYAQ